MKPLLVYKSNCRILWFSFTFSGGAPLPNILQEAHIDVITNDDCIGRWGAQRINDGHVCIFDYITGTRGACNVSILEKGQQEQ